MENNKFKILSNSSLKLIALLSMIIDHIGLFILYYIPSMNITLFKIFTQRMSIYNICRFIGRLSFPIFSFLIVEGYLHTRNKIRYGLSLFIFALISEIPYNYAYSNTAHYKYQNIFFTLLLGYLCIYLYELFKDKLLIQILLIPPIFLLAHYLKVDYGYKGVAFIFFLYILRNNMYGKTLIGPTFFNDYFPILLAFIPINMYNGKRGFINNPILKYLFYALYPIHLLLIYYIRLKILY